MAISPDGIPFHYERFAFHTTKRGKAYWNELIAGFERQGYYSSVNGRIPLDRLLFACRFPVIPKPRLRKGRSVLTLKIHTQCTR